MAIINNNDTHSTVNNQFNRNLVADSTAISPSVPELVPHLLDKITSFNHSFNINDSKKRFDLLNVARLLVSALEHPRESMLRLCWSQSTTHAAIDTAVNMGLFITLSRDENPKTANELAKASGGDLKLVVRISISIFLSASN
ncbi:uncharacterized protein N7443_000363 [Penicillium atrosanguineum]|uniref:uncharacterized protein n=1 Tax=Penicillium atrosanguineum TaxID=1132637 RepID=UPI0023850B86|nr:uncharacterized protein N7443_000363 [Penicillium atrosanguineum]KAJ5313479.1 hypothetical protein N7443_000363 [Penicillium atrosanguineum]